MGTKKKILCHTELLHMIQCLKFYKRDNLVSKCMESKEAYQECTFQELKRDPNAFNIMMNDNNNDNNNNNNNNNVDG